ncbi:LamG-like jellyroll fold domain-containing protein [Nonomuraea sp. SYSU D8015]|uniref:LamG-like jellyroll fold domain-containing protein n=1 Tax=Nonomuraea sp. SYSU D8015 TaxID=2593644 RepID=UPI0016608E29|nr:LamG-like jellyroll fold domain-containing protein [Nonomuraea sp. SYSU D8015]
MAVRFDADGESYTRSTGLGTVTNWSVACWAKLAVDRAATTVVWQIDDGAGATYLRVNAWNGTALTFQTSGNSWFGLAGHTLVIDEWTFIGLSSTANPGQARVRIRTASSSTFVGGSPTQANVTISAATLRIGDGQGASEWLNGSIAAVKAWDAALTMDELELESWQYLPQRTANLRAWYPFVRVEGTDLSGNSQTLSGGTGAALDDGPPISWSTGRHRTGVRVLDTVTGSLAGTLPTATASSAGTVTVSGTLTALAPAATADLTGNLNTNHLAGVLPAATASMAATVEVSGSAASTIPAAAGAFAGEVEIPANDITVTPGPLARGWQSTPPDRSWKSGTAGRGWKTGTPTT